MAAEFSKLISIGINQTVISKSIASADELAVKIKELRDAQKKSGVADAESTAQIKQLTQERNRNIDVVKQANVLQAATISSNQELKAQLSLLTAQYNNLSKAEKDTTEQGQKMGKTIRAISDELKSNESAIGNNTRNVGNYKDAWGGFTDSLKSGVNPLKAAKDGISGVNATMAANPIGFIVQLLMSLFNALKGNAEVADVMERAMGGLNKIFNLVVDSVVGLVKPLKSVFEDPKQAIIDLGNLIKDNIINRFKAFGVVASAIGKILSGDLKQGLKELADGAIQLGTGVTGATDKLNKLGGSFSGAGKEGFDAAKKLDEFTVSQAKMNAQMKLNEKQISALERDLKNVGLTFEQRKKVATELADLEIKNSKIAQEAATEILNIEKLKLKGKTLNAAEEAKLIELTTDVQLAAEDEKIAAAMRSKRIAQLLKGEENADKSDSIAAQNAKEIEAEAKKLAAIAELQDKANASAAAEFAQRNYSEENKASLLTLDLIEKKRLAFLAAAQDEVEVNDWAKKEKEKAEIKAQEDTAKRLQAQAISEYTAKIEALALAETLENDAAELSITNEKDLADKKGKIALDYLTQKLAATIVLAMADKNMTDAEIKNIQLIDNEIKKIQADLSKTDVPTAASALGLTEDDFAAMQMGLQITTQAMQSLNDVLAADAQARIEEIDMRSAADILAIENSTLSQEQKAAKIKAVERKAAMDRYKIELEQFKSAKAISIVMAVISTAQAVMAAFTAGSSLGPAGVVAGPVMAAAAGVLGAVQIGLIASQKPPAAPAFAQGGYVSGAGTGTSDSIPAMLSDGESVNNARATAMFAPQLSAMNAAGGGVDWYRGDGYADGGLVRKFAAGGLAQSSGSIVQASEANAMMAEAVMSMQPVLVIEDFQSVQGRQIRTVENLEI